MIFHNSHEEFYKCPTTPVSVGREVRFRIKYDGEGKVFLRTWNNEEQLFLMRKISENIYECTITAPKTPCQFWYCFKIEDALETIYYGNNENQLGGVGKIYEDTLHSYLIVVYDENFSTPDYLHQGNIYQIFPDRFFKGNYEPPVMLEDRVVRPWHSDPLLQVDKNGDNYAHDFFMGNLRGIVEKLDYLYNLGIRTLYLNPIFKAGTNHRYDTGTYEEIDPYLGNEEEFKLLCDELNKRNMHLILDGVFSHTGNDSLYFNQKGHYNSLGAAQSEESPYYDWYHFTEFPNKYACWWGIYTLPELNKNSKSYRDYLFNSNGIVKKWLKLGSSAWRLDVADELPVDFLSELRQAVKSKSGNSALIGEVWEDASNKVSYEQVRCYCLGNTLDSVMNYPLRHAIIKFMLGNCTSQELANVILHQREVYPTPFYYSLMNLIGSHDRARILNVLAGEDHKDENRSYCKNIRLTEEQYKNSKKQYIQIMALLSALPGSPTIYYGDEVGMQGTSDPWNRRSYPWGYEDDELKEKIKEILNHRLNHQVLQTGHIDVFCPNEDTVEIVRYFQNGKDVFNRSVKNSKITFKLIRNNGFEWVYETISH